MMQSKEKWPGSWRMNSLNMAWERQNNSFEVHQCSEFEVYWWKRLKLFVKLHMVQSVVVHHLPFTFLIDEFVECSFTFVSFCHFGIFFFPIKIMISGSFLSSRFLLLWKKVWHKTSLWRVDILFLFCFISNYTISLKSDCISQSHVNYFHSIQNSLCK